MIEAARSAGSKRAKMKSDAELSLSKKRMKRMQNGLHNPFLPGKSFLNGDTTTPYEKKIVDLLVSSEELQNKGFSKKIISSFCLPCGIQQEVSERERIMMGAS